MVEAARTDRESPQTIEAHAAFARMNGLAQSLVLPEIHLLEVAPARQPRRAASHGFICTDSANLPGQPDLDDVAGGVRVSPLKFKKLTVERMEREQSDGWVLVEKLLSEALKV